MTLYSELQSNPEFTALRAVSAELGSDPLQVQGPGGNTSIKSGDLMWVKASGTWLSDALSTDLFVPVYHEALTEALAADDGRADDVGPFTCREENPSGLRASIEATVHASMPATVVLHTHCVATIAAAVRTDAPAFVKSKLAGLPYAFIPYAKPGIDLARAIREHAPGGTQILILGNHGLVTCGATVTEAHNLLQEVSARLAPSSLAGSAGIDDAFQDRLSGSGWIPVPHGPTQKIAHNARLLMLADGRTLYPDHLVFLGPGVTIVREGEQLTDVLDRAGQQQFPSKLVIVPGHGVAMPDTATASDIALARALGDVLVRIAPQATVSRLSEDQEAELLDWDAEVYRQSLNKAGR
ncbi:class II aldolase/adducin family protein [uncultured Roseibium sp.]|uniref:class II aldolase/adducin family protein n=1 Tax=uncultured Roseibium sp. TaxID=1936171 RepID=UPI0026257BC5|nr:class II aldolase/adducin family protein [uncultured Roseibium sp.]